MYHTYKNGFIEVVCGPMFAGKTEELIRRIKRLEYAKQNVLVFKPAIDNRYSLKPEIVSHNLSKKPSIVVSSSSEILSQVEKDTHAVVIDEAQFFSSELVDVCNTLANRGIRVIVAGLDMDFSGKPFGPMPNLMAIAEEVTKVHAVCSETGDPALYSYRKGKNDNVVLLGKKNEYEPLSRKAFISKMKNK